jgi:hypothetical protein
MISFVLLITITMLNFIVAILTDTYTFLKDYSKAIYLKEIMYLNEKMGHEKYFSSIVSAWIPLNIIIVPILPILLLRN